MTNGDRIRAMTDDELYGLMRNPFYVCDFRTNEECLYLYRNECSNCVWDLLLQEEEKKKQ